ncbi:MULTISPECIES: PTS glucitol/sorbitol transporter subunit IIA [Enterococcus]|uniref:PTS system, glucitol/sorbitol-specific IIA component n=1 Tax=Candidatus Enterococcus mangumiae TaxID=2230878 RepID=A0ABZ2SY24_9ENTE|nr:MULTISPECIES: PTS glucitol/sorbitol transporter subunit IIA [unclassified Enterococcus]MBO0460225.1 PTS glucitol/sorbitol transporter subunit IIA [Enterococcus sp. DIV1298c]MBO0489728.1 PTS glucitol/sorbitol transporter subunit IIA [Enterococcus sp. DIV1094]MBO1299642.1 PTS glucitol/sorbitol transporter subunit IIA [Enterococcus sp. DIV1271a]
MLKSKVKEIGELVEAFEEEMLLILFGPSATEELKSICVIHETMDTKKNVLSPGTAIQFGDTSYKITKVGNAANQNFDELGHVSIYFQEGENEILPGAISVEPSIYPKLAIGDMIKIGG